MVLLAGLIRSSCTAGVIWGSHSSCSNLPQISFSQYTLMTFFFSSMTIPAPLKQSVKLSQKTKITSCPEKLNVLAQPTAITTNGCPDGGSFPPDPCISTQRQALSSFAGQICKKQMVPTRRSYQLLFMINVHLRSSTHCPSILLLTVTVNGGFSYPQFAHFLICKKI